MTPFGAKVRMHREDKAITQKQMAKMLGISPAYLSALEKGKRGYPSVQIVHRICGFLNIIWDEADELMRLAQLSHPRITVNTVGMSPLATEVANRLAESIGGLDMKKLEAINKILKEK